MESTASFAALVVHIFAGADHGVDNGVGGVTSFSVKERSRFLFRKEEGKESKRERDGREREKKRRRTKRKRNGKVGKERQRKERRRGGMEKAKQRKGKTTKRKESGDPRYKSRCSQSYKHPHAGLKLTPMHAPAHKLTFRTEPEND